MSDIPPPDHLRGAMATIHTDPNQVIRDQMGNQPPNADDPAWQAPRDPLKNGTDQVGIIEREIPVINVQTGWEIGQVRSAIQSLVNGLFDAPAQLVDSLFGDSRVHSATQSRAGGLLGAPMKFELPPQYKDSPLAKECLDQWQAHWPMMATEPVMFSMSAWATCLGFWTGQALWDTSGSYWKPYVSMWHPRYTYYHWMYRRYIAITQDNQTPITPGDGHWIMHAPFGAYRGWMHGALRSIAPWWLARNYALRDWARYSERHGMPIGKAITPPGADPIMIQQFRAQVSQLGQESIIQLPQSQMPEIGSYNFEWLETKDQAWDGFAGLITQCNAEITLAILGQNLTSEVKEGSFAAARVHADVRQAFLEFDARALAQTIYMQLARPFAAVNFGNPDLAPRVSWDLMPYEDNKVAADTLYAISNAVNILRVGGYEIGNLPQFARQFGISFVGADLKSVDPVQIEVKKIAVEDASDPESKPSEIPKV